MPNVCWRDRLRVSGFGADLGLSYSLARCENVESNIRCDFAGKRRYCGLGLGNQEERGR